MTTALAPMPLWLQVDDGRVIPLDLARWLGEADDVDERLLDRTIGPVLDVGCGPGRMVRALCDRGIDALGVDVSRSAVSVARDRSTAVMLGSVFDPLPSEGQWGSALLLDGSVGIGGDPVLLLRRVGELLVPRGRVLVEVEPGAGTSESLLVRLASASRVGPWFRWARVSVVGLAELVFHAGFAVEETWDDVGRHFARLEALPARR